MKLQVITNLFPLPWEPDRASFNRQQFQNLGQQIDVRITVLVAWLDVLRNRRSAKHPADFPGLAVDYLWYFYLPGIFRASYAASVFAALLTRLGKIRAFRPDCLLLSWAYPDAVAGTVLGRLLNIPVVIKVHGTDINDYIRYPSRARQIAWAMNRADAVISVSKALAGKIEQLGIAGDKIKVIYNGIDHSLFKPGDAAEARRRLNLDADRKPLLFIGNLKQDKGCLDLLDAFIAVTASAENVDLYFVGSGAEAERLQAVITEHQLGDRVKLVGSVRHAEIATWLCASHLVALPSYNEGVPNVLLEAMACGTPVVATRVGGIPEIVAEQAGLLVDPHDAGALQAALRDALCRDWDSESIAQSVSDFRWETNTRQVVELLDSVISNHGT